MGSPPGYEPRRKEGGSPGGALGIFLLTLVVTALLGGCALLVGADLSGLGCAMGGGCGPTSDHGNLAGGVVLGVLAGVCLVGGLVWAVRVGSGEAAPVEPPSAAGRAAKPLAAPPGRLAATWKVTEPGAPLRAGPGGVPVAWLAPGTVVTEHERQGEEVRVATLRGTVGWVNADRLESTGEGGGRNG